MIIQTPTPPNSRSGNRVTAERWQVILQDLGRHVDITSSYACEQANALIAIHGWRSADAITRFRDAQPAKPIFVCLSGTDICA